MQISSDPSAAMANITRSLEQVNRLNQEILDRSSGLAQKMLRVNVAEKVSTPAEGQETGRGGNIDLKA